MALIFLAIGIGLAALGMQPKFGKNVFTGVAACTVLCFVLLMAGAPVPGELILMALPSLLVAFLRAKPGKKKEPEEAADEPTKQRVRRGDWGGATWKTRRSPTAMG